MLLNCQYAVARFLPYVETEEFANFGVVLWCPERAYFGFKLLGKQAARITGFFDELDPLVYRRARETMHAELTRVREQSGRIGRSLHSESPLLAEIVRPRESIIRFSEMRIALADDPAAELDRLFDHYVRRSFATSEYKDGLVNRSMRRILKRAGIDDAFERATIEVGAYHVTFPFVRREDARITQIIKPLYLAYSDGSKILDHSWQWVGRFRRLRELPEMPEQILVPVEGPKKKHNELYAQYITARRELEDVNATVVPIEDEASIRDAILSKLAPRVNASLFR